MQTHALTHRRKPVELSKCTSCLHAGVLPCCSQPANGLLTVQALSQCFSHVQRDSFSSQISLSVLPLAGGSLFPWFSTGSLWQSWPTQVSELPSCLNRCTGANAAALAVCIVVVTDSFSKASRGKMCNEQDELILNLLTWKTLQIYEPLFLSQFNTSVGTT